MTTPEFFVPLESLMHQSLSDFQQTLRALTKKPAGTVQLSELCSMAEHPNGLYLFFDDKNEVWYVGKSTSRSFIERISAHFDQRPDAWFATLPRHVLSIAKTATYADALSLALTLRLVLIGVKSKEAAISLEGILRSYLKPKLNTPRRPRDYVGTETLSSLLGNEI